MNDLVRRLKQIGAILGVGVVWLLLIYAVGWLEDKVLRWISPLLFPHGAPKWVSNGLLVTGITLAIVVILRTFSSSTMSYRSRSSLSIRLGKRDGDRIVFQKAEEKLEISELSARILFETLRVEELSSDIDITEMLKSLPAPEPAQFVNISIAEDTGQTPRPLAIHEGIYTNIEYVLGVRIGISADPRFSGTQQRGLTPLAEETISLDAVVVLADGLEIAGHSWDTIRWAPVGESSTANFRIKATANAGLPARLKVILFHEFELIFCSDIHFDVMSEGDEWPETNIGVRWKEIPTEQATSLSIFRRFEDLNRHQKRSLNISIHKRHDSNYDLLFCLRNDDRRSILPVSVAVSHSELTGLLTRSRSAFRRLVEDRKFKIDAPACSFLSDRPIESKSDALKSQAVQVLLESMTILGRDLRQVLFGSDQGRRLYEKIENTLRAEKDAIVQVWTDASSNDFVFPWVWLHSEEVPSGQTVRIDQSVFWGYRFVIEQVRYSPLKLRPTNPLHAKPITLAAGLHSFPDREHQRNEFRSWAALCPGHFNWQEISQEDWTQFLSQCDAHIVYLYCHGHTELPYDPQNAQLIQTLKRLAEAVDTDLLSAINIDEQRKIRNSSFIQMEQAKLNLSDISRFKPATATLSPLVFLNMCESAELYPGLSNNFVDAFLQNGACGVLGTEIPMRAEYGNYFAQRFFDLMFLPDSSVTVSRSRSIGEVLLQMRREFLDSGNPLAFAYTYFGDANERFSPSVYKRET